MTRSKKKLIKLVKRTMPGEQLTLAEPDKTNLLGYLKLLIEMDLEASYPAFKDGHESNTLS